MNVTLPSETKVLPRSPALSLAAQRSRRDEDEQPSLPPPLAWLCFWPPARLPEIRVPFVATFTKHRRGTVLSAATSAAMPPSAMDDVTTQILRLRALLRLLLVLAQHSAARSTPLSVPLPRPNMCDTVTGDVTLFPTVSWRGDVMDEATAVAWTAMARLEESVNALSASHTGVVVSAAQRFQVLLGTDVRGQLPSEVAVNEQRLMRRLQEQLKREREQGGQREPPKMTASRYWDLHRAEKGATLYTDTPRLLPDIGNWINTALHSTCVRRLIRQFMPWVVVGTLFAETVMQVAPDEEPTEESVRRQLFDTTEEEAVEAAIAAFHAARRRGSTNPSASASASLRELRRRSTLRRGTVTAAPTPLRALHATSSDAASLSSPGALLSSPTSLKSTQVAPQATQPPAHITSLRLLRAYVDDVVEQAIQPILDWDAERRRTVAELRAKLLAERKRAIDRAIFALTMNPQLARQIDLISRTETIKRKGLLVAAYNDVEKILIRFGNLVVLGPKLPPFATVRDLRAVPSYVTVTPFGLSIDAFVDELSGETIPLNSATMMMEASGSDSSPTLPPGSALLSDDSATASPLQSSRQRQVSFGGGGTTADATSSTSTVSSPLVRKPQPSRLLRLSVASMMWASALQDVHERHKHLDEDEDSPPRPTAAPAAANVPPSQPSPSKASPPAPQLDFSAAQHRLSSWTEECDAPKEASPAPQRTTPPTWVRAIVNAMSSGNSNSNNNDIAEPVPQVADVAREASLASNALPPSREQPQRSLAPLEPVLLQAAIAGAPGGPHNAGGSAATHSAPSWVPSAAVVERDGDAELLTELLEAHMQRSRADGLASVTGRQDRSVAAARGGKEGCVLQRPPTTCVVVSSVLSMGHAVPSAPPPPTSPRHRQRPVPCPGRAAASHSARRAPPEKAAAALPFKFPSEYFDDAALSTLEYTPSAPRPKPVCVVAAPAIEACGNDADANGFADVSEVDEPLELMALPPITSPTGASVEGTASSFSFFGSSVDPSALARRLTLSHQRLSVSGSTHGQPSRGKARSSLMAVAAASTLARETAAAQRAAALRAKHDVEVDAEVARQLARRSSKELRRAVELAGIDLALFVGLPMATEMAEKEKGATEDPLVAVAPAAVGVGGGENVGPTTCTAVESVARLRAHIGPPASAHRAFRRPPVAVIPTDERIDAAAALHELDAEPDKMSLHAFVRASTAPRKGEKTTRPLHTVRRRAEDPRTPCRTFPDPELARLAVPRHDAIRGVGADGEAHRGGVDLYQVSEAVDAAYRRALALAASVAAPAEGDADANASKSTPRRRHPAPQPPRPSSLDVQAAARQRAVMHRKHQLALSNPAFADLL